VLTLEYTIEDERWVRLALDEVESMLGVRLVLLEGASTLELGAAEVDELCATEAHELVSTDANATLLVDVNST